jgi:membrane glycosyltransferase
MELHPAPGVNHAPIECRRYLARLPLTPAQREELLRAVHAREPRAAMAELHRALAGAPAAGDAAYDSIRARLRLAYGASASGAGRRIATDVQGRTRLVTAPPLRRTSMAPRPWPPKLTVWPLGTLAAWWRHLRGRAETGPAYPRHHWHRAAARRRLLLTSLVVLQTIAATLSMTTVLPYNGSQPLELVILLLFAVLFGWVSAGFWTAMVGFVLLLSGRDRYAISRTAADNTPIDAGARTAIVMPICNEHVARVFAGLRATYESLAATGELRHFDFFVLSDSSDPDIRVAETDAWLQLCRAVNGSGRVFYRRRLSRVKRKSGNVADFCRRWGRNYRYMVILDADSVMSGSCLTRLVRLMEANAEAGIIQTVPRASGRDTLYARIQQFANRAYGPLFTAGLHFWQLGESHYWGHNAIIRVAPFMRHCALGRLPGRGTLSGEILSHDFVEAALMRRAGWGVWLAYDLPGSYEEMPPNLLDELKRDRRWCQGNLINSRLLLAQGLHPAHRVVFVTGIMAYLSALLWFGFLLLSTLLLALHELVPPQYFVQPYQLFPRWPQWRLEWAIGLVTATAALLFLPKLLSVVLQLSAGRRRYGEGNRALLSTLAELVFSALLAPIRMLFHARFVAGALIGWSVQWKSPPREDTETSWHEAWRRHGWHTLLGLAWAGGVYLLNPAFLWWLLPVAGALIVSIPLSVYSSRVHLGRRLRQAGLFLISEESRPPAELRRTRGLLEHTPAAPDFVAAVVDPAINAMACAADTARVRRDETNRNALRQIARHALEHGPAALTAHQKNALLSDPLVLSELHVEVWTSALVHARWRAAQTELPTTPPERRAGAEEVVLSPRSRAAGTGRAREIQEFRADDAPGAGTAWRNENRDGTSAGSIRPESDARP